MGVCAVYALNTLLLAYCLCISSRAQSILSIRVSSVGKCVLPCCSDSHSPLLCLHTHVCMVILLDSLGLEHELWQSLTCHVGIPNLGKPIEQGNVIMKNRKWRSVQCGYWEEGQRESVSPWLQSVLLWGGLMGSLGLNRNSDWVKGWSLSHHPCLRTVYFKGVW